MVCLLTLVAQKFAKIIDIPIAIIICIVIESISICFFLFFGLLNEFLMNLARIRHGVLTLFAQKMYAKKLLPIFVQFIGHQILLLAY